MPLHTPIIGVDGTELREVPIPKGTLILPGYWVCNTNKALWGPDAWEWKPERWLKPLPEALLQARIPGVYSNLCVESTGLSRAPAVPGADANLGQNELWRWSSRLYWFPIRTNRNE